MKKHLLLILLTVVSFAGVKAQYVNIPDSAFRDYLSIYYPSCVNSSNQLDTVCAEYVTGNMNINYYTIGSLDGIQYFKSLYKLFVNNSTVNAIPALPKNLREFISQLTYGYTSLPPLPDSLTRLEIQQNGIASLPALPPTLKTIWLVNTALTALPPLPASLEDLTMYDAYYFNGSLPSLPPGLKILSVESIHLTSIPTLPGTLTVLYCPGNYNITSLPPLPSTLTTLNCSSANVTSLPVLPAGLLNLAIDATQIYSLPASLPPGLLSLSCAMSSTYDGSISSLPPLPSTLTYLDCSGSRNNITCLPALPAGLTTLKIDTSKIKCIPNSGAGLVVYHNYYQIGSYRLCNATNNINGCMAFPIMQGNVFYDLNGNGVQDAGEYNKRYGRVNLSNGAFTFTNNSGNYRLGADTLGAFSVAATVPPFFNGVPASTTYNFSTYDTTVTKNIALQPTVSHDSVNINITPFGWRARPGFPVAYKVSYKNAGSTNLSTTDILLHYNGALITFDSASNAAVTNAANTLSLHLSSLPVGDFDEYIAYFTVSPAAPLGSILTTDAAITSAANNGVDTARMLIAGSYDPNDKDATPVLTQQQVSNGAYIDYVIRFQNTGTDTAIHVVITDTLSSQLQANTLELISTSHSCIATVEGNVATFEMRNIMLPDSNINEQASHGFIRFKMKPVSTLVVGNTVNNKAAIYFDYNSPVITNTAVTQIMSQVVPLKLISFKGNRTENGTINLYWHTNNEMNTKSFVIEQSTNTREFSKVAEVRAIGNGNNNYTQNITTSATGNLYFRLKMFDKDGTFSYSPVILIRDLSKAGFLLNENPVKNEIVLNAVTSSLLNTEGVLVNNIGAVVKRFTIRSSSQTISVSELSSGVYYLKTIQGNEKVIISR